MGNFFLNNNDTWILYGVAWFDFSLYHHCAFGSDS